MNAKIMGSVLVVVAMGLLVGCFGGPAAATVSGEVKVDGKPLERGTITFAPADGQGAPASGIIERGRYEVQTTAGKKIVQISAPVIVDHKKESETPGAKMIDITVETLPDRYHSKSELTLEVQSGSNTKSWELSKKK